MYAKYQYSAGATTANILADVVAIVTGESNVNNLSASCDKANSTIVADVAAGWVLHDAAAGTNAKAVKAALADDAATFKYVVADTNTANTIFSKVYETWDVGTHVGTNKCNNSDTAGYNQQINTTTGGILHIFATARFLLLCSQLGSTWGSSTYAGSSGCFERTRVCPWDTVAAGYPPYLFANLGYWAFNDTSACMPRKLLRTGVVNTGSTASLNAYVLPWGSLSGAETLINGADQKVQNPSGTGLIPLLPIMLADSTAMPMQYGEISSLCEVWMIPQGVAANLDTITISGVTYLCLQSYNTSRMFAVRKG